MRRKNFDLKPEKILLCIFLCLRFSAILKAESRSDSLYWMPLDLPTRERVAKLCALNDSTGWIVTEYGHLYHLRNNQWQSIQFSPDEKVWGIFALNLNDVWAAIEVKSHYRFGFRHFDGRTWGLMFAPNTVPVRNMFFLNAHDGWAICEWGEIIHYDGVSWQRVKSPTNYHLNFILMTGPDEGWITGRQKNRGVILRYQNGQWRIFRRHLTGFMDRIIQQDSLIWIGTTDATIFQIQGDSIHQVSLPVTQKNIGSNRDFILFKFRDQICCQIQKTDQFYHFTINGWQRLPWKITTRGQSFELTFPFVFWLVNNNTHEIFRPRSTFNPATIIKVPFQSFFRGDVTSKYEFGVALGDIDQDDLLDTYVVDHQGINHLIAGRPVEESPFLAGSTAAAEKAGIAGQIRVNEANPNPNIYDAGVSFADIENDGDLDLYLCSFYHANLLYQNDGAGHFTDITRRAGVGGEEQAFSNLGCWADVNQDGLLDLLVTNQTRSDRLYINQGNGRFRDVTRAAGLATEFGSMCASFSDIDNDGDLDLIIPNQQGSVRVMRHTGIDPQTHVPNYEDVTIAAGLANWPTARCQHATLGDVDNDGDPDLFVTFALVPDKLFLNDGLGHFQDISLQAGFCDSTNSKGALFFDADNDGWLDLFVGGKGATWFYQNLGQGRFEDATEKMHLKLYSDINGIACGDFDTDKSPAMRGALDLYVASYDQSSAIFINPNGGQNYFKFKLIGTVSNRDAIGARVFLYVADHLGEKVYLRGMREVAASGGYFSMSSTIVHFGADPQLKYDARFVFPSGIEVLRRNLTPGIYLKIYEQTGWARQVVETKRWFLRNLSNPANQREALWWLLFLLLLAGTYSYCLKKAWGNWWMHLAMLGPSVILFFLIKILTREHSLWLFDGLAFTLSALLLGLGCWFNYRVSQQLTREERLRTLLNSCRAFEHSQWLSSGFNQLGLLFVNIEPLQPVPTDLKNLVTASIDNFYQFIYQEIDKISELARHVFPGIDATQKLKIMNLKLSRLLNQAKIEVELKNCISQEQHQNIPRYVTQIQKHLKAIANKVDQNFAAPLLEVLQRVQQDYAPAEIDISIQPALNAPEIQVRMLPSELLMVLNTLFSNALRAMAQQTTRKIKIQIQADQFEVRLSFRDNGCGIEPEFQTGLFMNGHTSKSDHTGGFGLFHAKSMLNLYGGEIQLASSTPGQGTEFLVTFRRID